MKNAKKIWQTISERLFFVIKKKYSFDERVDIFLGFIEMVSKEFSVAMKNRVPPNLKTATFDGRIPLYSACDYLIFRGKLRANIPNPVFVYEYFHTVRDVQPKYNDMKSTGNANKTEKKA